MQTLLVFIAQILIKETPMITTTAQRSSRIYILSLILTLTGLMSACDLEITACLSDQDCASGEACVDTTASANLIEGIGFGSCLPKLKDQSQCAHFCSAEDEVCIEGAFSANCYTTYLNRSTERICHDDGVCASGSCSISEGNELGLCEPPAE